MFRNPICIFIFLLLAGCNEPTTAEPGNAGNATPSDPVAESGSAAETVSSEATAGEGGSRLTLDQIHSDIDVPALTVPWTGDLDGMVERRVIRVLTVYGLGRYYMEDGQEKGLTYELFKLFEDAINKREGKKHIRVHVLFIPVARDELIPGLLEGRGDIAAAGLTITPERDELIDFSDPLTRKLSEILVTGPGAPDLASIDDLGGREVFVRASSSYRASLDTVNQRLLSEGKPEISVVEISEFLEDEDLLEMVNTGALEWAVVDDYKANNWSAIFENLTPREDIVFRQGGQLAFAFRENSPRLKEFVNEFVKGHRQGTLKGNILINRYYRDFDWKRNALGADDYERFLSVVGIFEKYGNEYGIDYLIVTAQGYQESRLDQSARSRAGAVGIMQLLPSTAADPNVGIADISTAEANIHAGVRYLNFIRDRYFRDTGMDRFNQTLFALAAYNAGPARVAKLRAKAEQQGYDPNLWFDNVEIIAAREIGRETVQYVTNILKYYVVYRLSIARTLQRQEDRKRHGVE